MFKSFFPAPKAFFLSFAVWFFINLALWYSGGRDWGVFIGFPHNYATADVPVGVSRFWAPSFLWFYLWFIVSTTIFASFWRVVANHPWQAWSLWGTALILFNIWFDVELSVALNAWNGPFGDLIQKMLTNHSGGDVHDLYRITMTAIWILSFSVTLTVVNSFFVSHYIFRWRTAMNDYYTESWSKLRQIEGASQRVQEDTMRFATSLETLGVKLIQSVMVLIAFFPVLVRLSTHVPTLPILGEIKNSLVYAAIGWALFGTFLLVVVGIKLPGLEFNNQKVEAQYRKELVYGEDNTEYAKPLTLKKLFGSVRKNYFRLYFHYAYFNVFSAWYAQLDNIFSVMVLYPSIAAGILTLGLLNQISNVFDQVRQSFQYLASSWKSIIELLSIYKRLKAFESVLK